MKCKTCDYDGDEFYESNKARCKECVKKDVRENRAENAEYYRQYDADRFQNDPRVKERHKAYQETGAGKAAGIKAKRKWSASNPIKRGASYMVNNAVRDGRLHKPEECGFCGATGRIHGHHDDYSRPLEVRWLCAGCHKQWHKHNGEGKNA